MAENITGKLFDDKYRVVSLLHESELGNFYRCRHAFTERPAILQVLRTEFANEPRAAERFSEMAKAASHIASPNILGVTDFGKSTDGQLYATLENIEGETLAEVIARDGQLPAPVALDIARQAAAGLSAAHDAGLVHGNLNSGDILVTDAADGSRNVKLFDFGSRNSASSNSADAGLSGRDVDYNAPELFSAGARPDNLTDIYSLGVLSYEMLAGDVPFTGETAEDTIKKHIEEAPPPLSSFRSDLPAGVEPIVLKALSKNPEMRYQTAGEFADAIELNSMNAGEPTAVAAGENNNIWKTAFVVLAGISLLSAFLIYGTSIKQTDPTTALQPDANGQPVQPINPATGTEEQNLALMPGMIYDANSNSNSMGQPPGTLPGGDGYNPWAGGVAPPPGGPPPTYVQPGGQVYTIDPNNPSQFMPADGGVVLVPVPANTITARPTPTPKASSANTNAQTAPPANTGAPKATPTPPAAKPAATPTKAPTKPPANTKPE
ncbi:MAG: serine/threonine-protein kinase [Acidobacteriota bacterium]